MSPNQQQEGLGIVNQLISDSTQDLKFGINERAKARAENVLYILDKGSYPTVVTNKFRALAHNNIGVACNNMGENKEALHHFNLAMKYAPENKTFNKNYQVVDRSVYTKKLVFGMIVGVICISAVLVIFANVYPSDSGNSKNINSKERKQDEYESAINYAHAACDSAAIDSNEWGGETAGPFSDTSHYGRYASFMRDDGVISIAGNDVKLKNGFGAERWVEYTCLYDPKSKSVLNVSAF